MKPYEHQTRISLEAYGLLKRYGLVYLAMQERTGKTLTSILTCEMCSDNQKEILVITKKKAIKGWENTLKAYKHNKVYTIANYEMLHKVTKKFDLVIIDEAHSKIASFPKRSETWELVAKFTKNKPLIFLSATPSAQSYSQLYHQLKLSTWSPWAKFSNFYDWHRAYGIAKQTRVAGGRLINVYNETRKDLIDATTKHLFISYTRKQLGFEHEPQDNKIYIEPTKETKALYNALSKDMVVEIQGNTYVADVVIKLRMGLHQIEGGTLKIDDTTSIVLGNTEKIDWIKNNYGDSADVVIFYQFVHEEKLLKKHFKNATVLQGTSYAEGVDLSMYKTLIIYSMDYSTSKYTQRRARQANMQRKEEIIVKYLLIKGAISDQVFTTVVENNKNYVDSYFSNSGI